MSVTVNLKMADFGRFALRFPDAVKAAVRKSISRIETMAKTLTPKNTGALANSVRVVTTPQGVKIEWTAPYAKIVEEGARPHIITPKKAKALRFFGPSGVVFAKKVSHPGFAGLHYKTPLRTTALEIIKSSILDEIVRLV